MTIRELLDFLGCGEDIVIKPNGRRKYYNGRADGVPEGMMHLIVTGFYPCVRDTLQDDVFLTVKVNADSDWDLISDGVGVCDDAVSAVFDGLYYAFINDREFYEKDFKDGIEKNREKRRERYWTAQGKEKPKKIEMPLEWVVNMEVADVADALVELMGDE